MELLTVVVAALAAYLLWHQVELQRMQLRSEFFDRRLAVVEACALALEDAFPDMDCGFDYSAILRLRSALQTAPFLFDEGTMEFLQEFEAHFEAVIESRRSGGLVSRSPEEMRDQLRKAQLSTEWLLKLINERSLARKFSKEMTIREPGRTRRFIGRRS